MEEQKFQSEGIRWLFELELINHPQLINHLKLNTLATSEYIKDCEFLLDQNNKRALVFLKLSWWGNRFYRSELFQDVEIVLSQMLPSFKFRVIDDSKLFKMALDRVAEVLGGSRAKTNLSGNSDLVVNSAALPTVGVPTSEGAKSSSAETGLKE